MITLQKLTPYTGDILAPSPNHDARKALAIEGIVLHATQDEGNGARALSWLRSPSSRVSCHLLVSRNGRVTRLVGDRQRAWHAGVSWWRGTSDVNSITLGIEIANRNDGEPYTDAQYARVASIVAHYCRQGLSLADIVSHQEIAPGRRTDPFGWNWRRFRSMVQDRLRPADVLSRSAPPVLPAGTRAPARVMTGALPSPSVIPSAAPPLLPLPTPVAASRAVPSAAKVPASTSRRAPSVVPPADATRKQRAPVLTTPKPVLHSRTLWLNGVTVLAAGAALLAEALKLAFGAGLVLPEDVTKWVLFGLGAVNMVLRLRTTQPLVCGTDNDCSCSEAPPASFSGTIASGAPRAAAH